MKNNFKVSIFIPTLNRAKDLGACLEAITKQTYKNFEVVVVNSNSTDDTKDIVKEYSKKLSIVYAEKTGGLASAANLGWRIATGDIVARIDDDSIVDPAWLEEIAKTFDSDEKIGGVTGPTVMPEDRVGGRDLIYFNNKMKNNPNLFWRLCSRIYHGYFMEENPFAVSKFFRSGAFSIGSNYKECLELEGLIPADHLEACNSSIRRELIEKAGGYDERYIGIGEYHEPDLAFKVKKLGYRLVFNPKASLCHCPNIGGLFKARSNSYGRSQNFILFYFRHIKPDTLDKFLRFFLYLMFINAYWFFKFLISGNPSVLNELTGTLVGLVKYIPELKRLK